MKAVEANLLQFMHQPKQLIIPIYQRMYSWTLAQCGQLWRDILRAGKDDSTPVHFVGSVVYIAQGGVAPLSSIPRLLLIDGQQRLTTITLLLKALALVSELPNNIGITRKKIENYYLFNADETGDLLYKLLLTRSDKETLTQLLQGIEPSEKVSVRVVENYRFFMEQLEKPGVDLQQVYAGIRKLIIVDIALDRDHDNPQLIFESLNSTGLELSQADLIRNYVLMGLEPQEQTAVYEHYWSPMEQAFGTHYVQWFDWFMRDYLTVRTGSIPNVRDVYTTFKSYCQSRPSPSVMQEIVADLYRLSKFFVRFVLEKEPTATLRAAFDDINTLRVNVAFPFFLSIYEDYNTGILSEHDFVLIVRLIESYVFRRAVCGIPTNSLNRTFASLRSEIDKTDYLNSFQAAMLRKDSYRRFPTDQEMHQELLVKDIYSLRNRNYLLAKLENYEHKEPVSIETYTVEHILPQNKNLRPEWREALGPKWQEIQAKYLHTLGNLTLTGYNSEYSDRPFSEKRDMTGGFKESHLRLNMDLGQQDTWNETTICERAAKLTNKAVKIWPYPALPPDVAALYMTNAPDDNAGQRTLEEHVGYLDAEMLPIFEEFRKRALNLDAGVREEPKKNYVAYKAATNFVDVIFQKKKLVLTLNMEYSAVYDPQGLCKDVTGVGKWGNGNVQVSLETTNQINAVMALVRQAFNLQMEDGDGMQEEPPV